MLILTAEVVDQRRALFKRIAGIGVVVDCGVRTGKVGETQMKPELARARIKDVVIRAGRRIYEEAIQSVVERTGFSMRDWNQNWKRFSCTSGTVRRSTRRTSWPC